MNLDSNSLDRAMASHFELSVLTPGRALFGGEVENVEAPGTEGYFGVLAHRRDRV